MKVTFPHMGNTFIVAKVLLDSLGVDYIIPPSISKKELEIGLRYCPEMACIPLKLNIGNFMQAINMGADTILMVGGFGPCRLGYYGEMHREILRYNGFDIEVITLEVSKGQVGEFISKIKRITNNSSYFKVVKAVRDAAKAANYVDQLEKLTFKTRPREKVKGETDKIYSEFLNKILKVKGIKEVKSLVEHSVNRLSSIEMDKKFEPIRVGIVGEIFSIIEPFTNFNIEKKLGQMGVEVERSLMISDWIKEHIIKNALLLKKDSKLKKAAKPYLGRMIGGHAQETIGNTVLFSQRGYDGVVQIYPLTCMPEIVAGSILPNISNEHELPILSLIVDEMTGEEGFKTRLEAFVDLLNSRRERNNFGNESLLSWN